MSTEGEQDRRDNKHFLIGIGILAALLVLLGGAILFAPDSDAPRPQPTRPTTEHTVITPARPATPAPVVLLGDPCQPGERGVTGTGVTAVCVESGTQRGEATWRLGGWLVTPTPTAP
jgi:hypothetical protein